MTPPAPRTKAEQRDATRTALVANARQAFATVGYNGARLESIVEAAGVTKGALYHHFPGGKPDLFRAVLRHVHEEVANEIADSAPDADAWTRLVSGCRTFLSVSTAPSVQQIMLMDGPAVLGWDVWRELDAATSMSHLESILRALMAEGSIVDQPIDPLVHLLSGAMNEAALWLAHTPDPQHRLAETMAVLNRLLESLRPVARD